MGVIVKEKVEGSGVWWVFVNHNGKRKAKKFGRDKKKAVKAARKIEAKLVLGDLNLFDESSAPTFKEYAEQWLDGYAKLSLKNSTHRCYKSLLNTHLIPVLGPKPLNAITSKDISEILIATIKNGRRSKTALSLKALLSAIFHHAVNPDGHITANPVRGVPVPRPEDERASRVPDPLTWAERDIFEAAFMEHDRDYYPLVFCGFRTGLRIGELAGLQWGDVDFQNRVILVQRNVVRGRVTTPKSRAGRRLVRMTSGLVEVLERHKKNMIERTLKRGWKEVPEWVFVSEDGNHIHYNNFVYYVWDRVVKKTKLRRRTPHDMRHTYATLRLSKGDPLAEVSKEMGHWSPTLTYKTYFKWMPTESRTDIDELDSRTRPDATQAQPENKTRAAASR